MAGRHRTASVNAVAERESDSSINGIKFELDSEKVISVEARECVSLKPFQLEYNALKLIGNGSFGIVFQAKLIDSGETVAIKKVLQDKRYKNRELDIMRVVSHHNIVGMKSFFFSPGDKDEVYLNLVLEFVPETVYRALRHYVRARQSMPKLQIKLYMYQLFRSLTYIHSRKICHRDIKPQNLLLDPERGILKLCDFGSAKILVVGEANVSYICSRFYRAPELVFGAQDYTTAIDIWSSGCVLAELVIGQPLFPGESGIDQLVEIIKILGTPTRNQIYAMNQNYTDFKFPNIKSQKWNKILRSRTSPDLEDLISKIIHYPPKERLTAIEAMAHPFFDELRNPATKLPGGRELPPLFDFSEEELAMRPDLNRILVPAHAENEIRSRVDLDKYLSPASSGNA